MGSLHITKRMFHKHHTNWHDYLPFALSSYQTRSIDQTRPCLLCVRCWSSTTYGDLGVVCVCSFGYPRWTCRHTFNRSRALEEGVHKAVQKSGLCKKPSRASNKMVHPTLLKEGGLVLKAALHVNLVSSTFTKMGRTLHSCYCYNGAYFELLYSAY